MLACWGSAGAGGAVPLAQAQVQLDDWQAALNHNCFVRVLTPAKPPVGCSLPACTDAAACHIPYAPSPSLLPHTSAPGFLCALNLDRICPPAGSVLQHPLPDCVWSGAHCGRGGCQLRHTSGLRGGALQDRGVCWLQGAVWPTTGHLLPSAQDMTVPCPFLACWAVQSKHFSSCNSPPNIIPAHPLARSACSMQTIARRIPQIAYLSTLAIRFANNVVGGENFIDMARWAGVQ